MLVNKKTLEKLRIIINADGTVDHRSGSKLVAFFNELGFNDVYGNGFPSRCAYTDDKLAKINGTPKLDECIRNVFAVVNYIDRISELDTLIADFNKYLAFDEWSVIRDNARIDFKKLEHIVIDTKPDKTSINEEADFLNQKYNIDVNSLQLDNSVRQIIQDRLHEINLCIHNEAPLAAIFLVGSVLEGILLGTAIAHPKQFNLAVSAPKDVATGKVRRFTDWTLNNFIDVAAEIGILKQDVKKFSHVVRDFRNYIHPYQQMAEQFNPDVHTALICFQVLQAAIVQIGNYNNGGSR